MMQVLLADPVVQEKVLASSDPWGMAGQGGTGESWERRAGTDRQINEMMQVTSADPVVQEKVLTSLRAAHYAVSRARAANQRGGEWRDGGGESVGGQWESGGGAGEKRRSEGVGREGGGGENERVGEGQERKEGRTGRGARGWGR